MTIRRFLSGSRSAAIATFALFIAPVATAPITMVTIAMAADADLYFVSIRASEVNVRTGPGKRYPIDWVFTRRGLPVEVLANYDSWRQIRAKDGTTGWVHQSMLSRRRTVVIDSALTTLLDKPRADATIVARAEPGVIGELLECDQGWCRVEVTGLRGWVPKAGLWGVLPGEGR